MELPDTWPDRLQLSNPRDLFTLFRCILGKRRRVEIPASMPGRDKIPKYILQEFHNLPNGNYSNVLTRGYAKGFDISMLNMVDTTRQKLADAVCHANSVLDIGTAGGKTAAAVFDRGNRDVWGLDPSPYLLKHAATGNPGIRFVQGTAEQTGFGNERFDGITACFVFHEIPPCYQEKALAEMNRILKPGGIIAIAEPSAIQLRTDNNMSLIRNHGLKALYFKLLANCVYEPFVEAWHEQDVQALFARHGFELLEDRDVCPIRTLVAHKQARSLA